MKSIIFNSLSTAVQNKLNAAVDDMEKKATGIKNAFAIIGQDIVSGGKSVGNGVQAIVTEATAMLEDLGIYDPNAPDPNIELQRITDQIMGAKGILISAKAVVDANQLNDPTMQHIINENLRMAMEAAQESLDSQYDEANRMKLIGKMNNVKESITTATEQIKEGIVSDASAIKAHVAIIKGSIYDAWMKGNFGQTSHPDGYALTANALKGAKEAMNDKYGEGSVVW